MVKRKFRIVKREKNRPVLGVCEYCNAEFTADPETIGRPQDAHAFIQKQFIAHECERLGTIPECRYELQVFKHEALQRWLKITICG
jgi:hypothetical protein